MRYIDQDEIELDLPNDWEDKVEKAWAYVEKKISEAEQEVFDKAETNGWNGDQLELDQKVESARISARKKAISNKSEVWSHLSDLLSAQSKGKCWYCETNDIRSDKPVDHFRPKNNVTECQGHHGYWWLAFDWRNYRYSCTYCNSRRVEVETAGGKQDHFPLFIPPDWNKCAEDRNLERPMLLDPVNDSDCKLITFNDNGEACSVIDDDKTEVFKRVEKSIELYHLNHKPTTRARKSIFQRIRTLVASTNELLAGGFDENAIAIKANRKELFRLIRPECKTTRFHTAARIYLKKFEDGNQWVKDILDRA